MGEVKQVEAVAPRLVKDIPESEKPYHGILRPRAMGEEREIIAALKAFCDRAAARPVELPPADEWPMGADEADMIIAAGRRMAARIGAEFVIDPQKLADFRALAKAESSHGA